MSRVRVPEKPFSVNTFEAASKILSSVESSVMVIVINSLTKIELIF